MNKTVVFVVFACLAAVGLAGAVILAIFRPNAVSSFVQTVVLVLGLASTAAGTFYTLGQQGKKIDTIEQNTNGRLHTRDAEISRLTDVLIEHGLDPNAPTTGTIATVNSKPKHAAPLRSRAEAE